MEANAVVARAISRAAKRAPYLSREEERALARRWVAERDEAALHRLVAAHMRLALSVAVKFRHYGLALDDLVQEGHVGLLEAAARFEPERDVRFSTYATWWIRAAIQDHILRNWSIVRGGTSSAQKALFFNLRRLRARLTARGSDEPGATIRQRIATAVGVSVRDVEAMEARLAGADVSLNASRGHDDDDAVERMDFLVDDAPRPDEVAETTIDGGRRADRVQAALACLSEREVRIVRERRMGDEPATLDSLGAVLRISKERVRQIECRALEKLRHALLDRAPDRACLR